MSMDDSNRKQTIQAAITLIVIVTFLGIVLSLTSCRASTTNTGTTYSTKELAYLADVKPVLGKNAVTAVQESAVISIGRLTCQQRGAGIPENTIVSGLGGSWTELEARVMYSSASKYFCE